MSTHSDCGEDIKWLQRDETKWLPPMEYAGTAYIVNSDGFGEEVTCYRPHRCDPDKVEAWQEYLSRMTDIKGADSYEGRIALHNAARERDREMTWESAFQVVCPTCSAEVDQRCINMSAHLRKTGEITFTVNPHPARLEAAYNQNRKAEV